MQAATGLPGRRRQRAGAASGTPRACSRSWPAGLFAVSGVSLFNAPASGGTYQRGDTIEVRVDFDRLVAVTGTPLVAVTVGSRTRSAAIESTAGPRSSASSLFFVFNASAPEWCERLVLVNKPDGGRRFKAFGMEGPVDVELRGRTFPASRWYGGKVLQMKLTADEVAYLTGE